MRVDPRGEAAIDHALEPVGDAERRRRGDAQRRQRGGDMPRIAQRARPDDPEVAETPLARIGRGGGSRGAGHAAI